MRIDADLLAAAAEGSRPIAHGAKRLRAWIKGLSAAEKDRWLLRALDDSDPALGAELRAAFRRTQSDAQSQTRRTAGDLRARADELRAKHRAAEASAKGRERTKAARARASAPDGGKRRGRDRR
jgi:hypothetical protein